MAHRLKRAALAAAVLAAHLVLVDRFGALLEGGAREPMPERIAVVYLRTLQPSDPVALAPPRAPEAPARPRPVRRFEGEVPLALPWDEGGLERSARAEVIAAPGEPVAAPAPEPFDWPESTRLRYRVSGNYRGEVHGSAEVEWIRAGPRYQVHLDVIVGLPIAPLFSRRMTSDGSLTDDGLHPRRYDEETRVAFGDRRRATLQFDEAVVRGPRGRMAARPPGLQDSASQFVQIAWLLAMRPELTRPGARIELPLALPRHVVPWIYEVAGEETVHADFGAVPALHLKPAGAPKPGDLSAQAWFAPGFRWLPVRILIRQDEATYVDLVLASLPELGNAATSAALR